MTARKPIHLLSKSHKSTLLWQRNHNATFETSGFVSEVTISIIINPPSEKNSVNSEDGESQYCLKQKASSLINAIRQKGSRTRIDIWIDCNTTWCLSVSSTGKTTAFVYYREHIDWSRGTHWLKDGSWVRNSETRAWNGGIRVLLELRSNQWWRFENGQWPPYHYLA